MSLSQINEAPLYFTTIPSTKEKVKYRPFLVKEERMLLTANESESADTMLATLEEVVRNCLVIKPKKLTTFDVEYLFTQIRAKSVSENSDIVITCSECDTKNDVELNLTKVEVFTPEGHTKNIKLSDTLAATMIYPNIQELLDIQQSEGREDAMFKIVRACIHSIYHEDMCYIIEEESDDEVNKFIDTLRPEQYQKLKDFVDTIPYARIIHKWKCTKCGAEHETTLKGIFSFF